MKQIITNFIVLLIFWLIEREIDKLRNRVTVLENRPALSTPRPAVEPIYFRF